MSLKEKIERAASLLEEKPAIERKVALASVVKKLNKALDDFISKSEPELYKDTKEYAELYALLTLPENKGTVTPEWLNEQAGNRKYAKAGKKEREAFAVMMVRDGHATAVIQELKESPKRKMQDALHSLAGMSKARAEEKIKLMKPKQLEEFCRLNEIEIARSPKGSLDKKRTLPNIMAKVVELREYLKL